MTAPTKPAAPAIQRRQFVTFQAADEVFAADIFAVERVLRYETPRLLPNSSSWLRGVIDNGGRTIPVVDLRRRLSLPATLETDRARTLLLSTGDSVVGLTVDAVHEVITVPAESIEAPPEIYKGLTRAYLAGVVRHKGQLVVVLEVSKLLSSIERIEMERALKGEPLTEPGTAPVTAPTLAPPQAVPQAPPSPKPPEKGGKRRG